MRINSLDVRAYGPFTNKRFDFSQGQGKLELIYGPNEAGKSSLLRTLCDFLFGIPVQTNDDFLHRKDSLRIGATIEHQGKSLAVLRRKGKGNTLSSEDEKVPISESEFRSVMPVDSRSIFETMFGIDADRLAEGGRELMSGRGDFGKMLFSAASGIEDLRGILAALTADADALFKVKGGSILKHLKECDELKKSISASLLTTSALADLTERREEAASKKDRLGKELRDKGVEERRLERMLEALDLLAQRQIKLAGLETLRMVRIARGGFETEFSRTEEALRHKREERRRIAQEAASLEGEITKLVFSESLLRHEGEVAKLKERVGAERKAAVDRVKRQANVMEAEARAAASFVELGIAADMESIPTLHVTAESRKQTVDLDSQFTRLNADGKNASREIVKLESEIEGNHRLLAALPEAKPTASLQQAMQATDLIAASAPDFTSRRARTAKDEKKLEADIRALPWHDSIDALESAALPSAALVDDWKQRMERAETRHQKAREQWAASDEQVRQCEAAIRQLQAGRSIPTLGAMENARRHRDLGWQAVRHAWLKGEIETGATPERLADAYQESVKAADSASDDLREHANEAAHFAQSQANLSRNAWPRMFRPFRKVGRKEPEPGSPTGRLR